MDRIRLTTRLRRKRRQELLEWFNYVVRVVVFIVVSLWIIAMVNTKLVEALVAMVNTGAFKADNGFKSGYLAYLEQAIKESLPSSGISGKPHIESKLKLMKKDWTVVHDMLSGSYTSGFGYDNVRHCVVADEQVWESYLQVHKGAGRWRNKTFPFYEDLCIVFGKDRAQGNHEKSW